jgi:leader peptidase (prepilin peptidase) / N-methyltransferase
MREIAFVLAFGASGAVAGLAGRRLLAGLRRGTSVHYGWCSVPISLLWSLIGLRLATGHLPAWWIPIPLALTWFAVLLTLTDLRHRRLPDALTLPAYPIAGVLVVGAASQGGWALAAGAALGTALFVGAHGGLRLLRPAAIGAGDVKLSGTLGAVLGAIGWPTLILATWLAALCTLALRFAAPRHLRAHWRTGTPHGPGLLAATCLIALFPARL